MGFLPQVRFLNFAFFLRADIDKKLWDAQDAETSAGSLYIRNEMIHAQEK